MLRIAAKLSRRHNLFRWRHLSKRESIFSPLFFSSILSRASPSPNPALPVSFATKNMQLISRFLQGLCKGASVGGQVKSWIDDHKALVIGIASAVGALILFSILGCIGRCIKRRRGPRANKQSHNPSPPPGGWNGYNAAPYQGGRGPPPAYNNQQPMMMSGGGGGPPGPMWYGNGAGQHPAPPPPSYVSRGTVRYA